MESRSHPRIKASGLSKLTLWWMNGLIHRGFKKRLEVKAIPDTLKEYSADYVTGRVNKYYQSPRAPKKNKLLWALVFAFKTKLLMAAVCALVTEAIRVGQPLIIGDLVDYFNSNGTHTYSGKPVVSDSFAYFLAALLTFFNFLFSLPNTWQFLLNGNAAAQMRTACCNMIFHKTLRLSQGSLHKVTTGRIVNMMATDVEKFIMTSFFYQYLWIAMLETGVITYLLYREVGVSCFPGLGVILLLLPIQGFLGSSLGKIRIAVANWSDKRVHVMSEIIGAMRVIKMYCWEKPFGDIIAKLRKKEMISIWKGTLIKGMTVTLAFMSPKLTTLLIILTYHLTGNEITASTVVKVISWTEVFKIAVTLFFPFAIQFVSELLASVDRIEQFLATEEFVSVKNEKNMDTSDDEDIIIMHDMSATWNGDNSEKNCSKAVLSEFDLSTKKNDSKPTLSGFNLHIRKGQLVAVVGEVGAGKSSILMTLLGELPSSSGTCNVFGKVSYVPQEAWVFQGTARENILFGETFRNGDYWSTVDSCALNKDFKTMPDYDRSIVGERGITLSGGQKARLNLARAVYRDADIYLLDDPLSAVDTKVARHIFEQCICGRLKNKTRILVTHQVQFLKKADLIIVIKDGSIHASGVYEEVTQFVDIENMMTSPKKGQESLERTYSGERSPSFQSSDITLLLENSEDDPKEGQSSDAVAKEEILVGKVGFKVYGSYFAAGLGWIFVPVYLLLAIGFQALINSSDWLIIDWEFRSDQRVTLYIYIGLALGAALMGIASAITFISMTSLASKNLHNKVFAAILRAPTIFFDQNPVGRVLNKFSRDIGFIDNLLPVTMFTIIQFSVGFLGSLILISVSIPWTVLLTVPVIVAIIGMRQYSLPATRDLKRIEAISRSPIYSQLSETLAGLPVIRAFKMEPFFVKEFSRYQDNQSSPWYLFKLSAHWLGIRLDWIIAVYFTGYMLAAFFIPHDAHGGILGLSFAYIIALLDLFQYVIRESAQAESYMTSVERIEEYTKLNQEADAHKGDFLPHPEWPSSGNLEFKNVCLAYNDNAGNILKNINFTVHDKEKIGIVGRTGAGKSSLITCLMRLSEPTGKIIIDGVNVLDLGLHDLRSSISTIPQDPVLFTGTLRYNLDPFSEYDDDQLWNAIAQVQLTEKVKSMEGGLYGEMSEAGGNLSMGQRQLVCLARAILRNKKILLIDEATANVDPQTDELIQKTLRHSFTQCTVLCIAHRLNTIIDSNKVLVLGNGEVKEFDHPHILLQRSDSHFHQMVWQAGPQTAQQLHFLAETAYLGSKSDSKNCVEDSDCGHGSSSSELVQSGHVNYAFTDDDGVVEQTNF